MSQTKFMNIFLIYTIIAGISGIIVGYIGRHYATLISKNSN